MVPDDVIVGMHHHGVEISPGTKAEAITAAVSTLREALADPDETSEDAGAAVAGGTEQGACGSELIPGP